MSAQWELVAVFARYLGVITRTVHLVAATAVGVAALAMVTACGGAPWRSINPLSGPAQTVQSSESGLAVPDFATLVRQSDLVIVGRIAAPGVTRQIAQPIQTPIGSISPVPGQPPRVPQAQPPGAASGGISIPVTTYPVDVERVVRGTATAGARITLTQSGNPIRGALPSGDDVPLADGEQDVLFLTKADDGTFFLVGGAQGRLTIDAQNRVHPVGSGSPATLSHDGQALDAFLADVASIG